MGNHDEFLLDAELVHTYTGAPQVVASINWTGATCLGSSSIFCATSRGLAKSRWRISVPVDHLHALRELAGHFKQYDLANTVVVSPDLGNAKAAAAFARLLGTPVAASAKQRFSDDHVEISAIIGDVAGRDIIVLDDEIARGSTVIELLERLRERDVRSVRIACTHGLFSAGALDHLDRQHDVLEIVSTNTVPIPAENGCPS